MGFHVDDAEVTLNVCLGKQFTGGELFFRGVRCDRHVNSPNQPEEILDYTHVPGQAVLHRGRHRHGARATTSGHRINLLLWCRSSVFRELKKYQKDFSGWCGECQREKKERQCQSVAAIKLFTALDYQLGPCIDWQLMKWIFLVHWFLGRKSLGGKKNLDDAASAALLHKKQVEDDEYKGIRVFDDCKFGGKEFGASVYVANQILGDSCIEIDCFSFSNGPEMQEFGLC
ncbi:hypothetical protein ACLOJK_032872 [Asimina triloba]